MNTIFNFGETVAGYNVKVLNEREARAGAGILFLFALIAFLNSFLIDNIILSKTFVTIFMLDFVIRVLINPRFSPSLIIGRFAVRNQSVEYVGAAQKRFAWALGLIMATSMFFLVVITNGFEPLNISICISCLTLLFFESSFGICLGCKLYNMVYKEKAQLCPGDVCEVRQKEEIQKLNFSHALVVASFVGLIFLVSNSALVKGGHSHDDLSVSDCKPPHCESVLHDKDSHDDN